MKTFTKIFSTVAAFCLTSSLTMASEVAASDGDRGSTSASATKKSVCPAKPKKDLKTAKACPKSLGEDALTMRTVEDFSIDEYDPETESYSLLGVRLPDEGPIPVTLEALAKSDAVLIGSTNPKEKMALLRKSLNSPCELLKKKFKLQRIQGLSLKDLKERKGCVRK